MRWLLEGTLVEFFSNIRISDKIKDRVLKRLKTVASPAHEERDRTDLLARQARNKRLFQLGDMDEAEYLKERAEIECALSKTQPLAQPKFEIEEAAKLLTTFGSVIAQATAEEKKVFFRTVLDEVVVKNKKIVDIRPKPNYYDLLLCVRSAPEWGRVHL